MSTPAIVTFKEEISLENNDINLRVLSDGYPDGIVDQLEELSGVAERIRSGEEIDFESLELPSGGDVFPSEAPSQATCASFRYEVLSVDGKTIVSAYRHEPSIPEELKERLSSARNALKEVEAEMLRAQTTPEYTEIGSGDIEAIRQLGDGYDEE